MVKKLETDSAIPPSTAVIEAIAEYKGVDPMDLTQPLYEAIDADALDTLLGNGKSVHPSSETTVQFTYDNCHVNVSSNGTVTVSSLHSAN